MLKRGGASVRGVHVAGGTWAQCVIASCQAADLSMSALKNR